jgi:hypothetical protein
MTMEFIAFPIRVGGDGWLRRSAGKMDGLMHLLGVMAGTPRGGWSGSEEFGAREKFLEMQTRWEARLIAANQINQALEDLGIDWVRLDKIEIQPATEPGSFSYVLTLSHAGEGAEKLRLELAAFD